jgi:hypothetical protein
VTLSLKRNYSGKITEVIMVNWRFFFTNIRWWMLNCISRFIQYRELLACKDPEDYFLQDFKKEVYALK